MDAMMKAIQDLDDFKEYRAEFDIHEWIDVVLTAIDYTELEIRIALTNPEKSGS